MKLNKLASAISRGTWLIDARAADILYPIATRFLNGENITWFTAEAEGKKDLLEAYSLSAAGGRYNIKASQDPTTPADNIFSDSPAGSIAMIPVDGTIMKDSYCGSAGTDDLASWLMAALAAPNIIGAILKINSPGGTVEGTQEFAEVVAFVDSLMPVEVFCDGELCSAAYWIAACCRITASSGTVGIGCIGAAASFKDYSAGSGVVSHFIAADAAFDKNAESLEAKKGNYAPIKANIINPTNDIFLNTVKAGRGDKLQLTDAKNDAGDVIGQYPLTGQVYLAQTAIDNGLIDAIGNLESVMASIRTRAAAQTSTSNQSNNMSLFGTKFKKLNALSGKKAADISDEEIVAVNQELQAEGIENVAIISSTHLTEADGNADMLSEGLTAVNAALGLTGEKAHKTLAAAITGLTAAHKAEFDRAEAYGKQPGAVVTKPKVKTAEGENAAEGGDQLEAPVANKFETSYDRELATIKKNALKDPFQ